jgi:predicted lipoprotein with Yx(FWY)xxD motif
MRSKGLALAALLSLTAALTAACGTTSATPGAAYGTTPAATATMPASPTTPTATASGSGAPMTAAKTTLTVRKTGIGYVLATAGGMTVYWYSDDVKGSGKSSCSGGCLSAWPAVTGAPAAAAGVKLSGKLGTITRAGGQVQATYNGYPLYTYAADMSAGQTQGNGIGGVWHVITGAALSASPAAAASASARDKSGGATNSPSAKASNSMGGY